jgi:uncharacterized protein (DUF1499 family)
MKKMIYWIAIFIFGLVCFLAILSIISRKKPALGMVEGRLRPCSGRPNCVCSEFKDSPSYVKPLKILGSPKNDWERAKRIIREMGGKIEFEDESYLWATFSTRIFRFVDDLELRIDGENEAIHIRSSSRVGYSDLGANRRRIEVFRERFNRGNSPAGKDTMVLPAT